jgi:hypothetical protein
MESDPAFEMSHNLNMPKTNNFTIKIKMDLKEIDGWIGYIRLITIDTSSELW